MSLSLSPHPFTNLIPLHSRGRDAEFSPELDLEFKSTLPVNQNSKRETQRLLLRGAAYLWCDGNYPLLAKMGERGSYLSSLSPPFSIFFHSPPSSLNPVSICFTPFLLPPLSHPFFIPPFFDLAPNAFNPTFVSFSAVVELNRAQQPVAADEKGIWSLFPSPLPAVYTVHLSISIYSSRKNDWEEGGRRRKRREGSFP